MAVIPANSSMLDAYTILYWWTGFLPDDNGEPIQVFAYPSLVWQLTGHITGNTDNAAINIMGSNDYTCWCPLHCLVPPPDFADPPEYWNGVDGALKHSYTDRMFDGSHLPRARWIMPRRKRGDGTHNDLSVFLFASRPWGVRGVPT